MDILYIIGKNCSKCNDNELRYSLRSIERYGENVDRIFIVGYCPEWLSDNVIKVPFEQPYQKDESWEELDIKERIARKHCNMLASILYAIDNTDIGDEFLVSCDDHIYIRPVDFNNYPFYYRGCLLPKVGNSEYGKSLAETRKILEEQKLSRLFLILHRNMPVSRKIVAECREFLDYAIEKALPIEPFAYLNNYRYTKYHDFKPVPVTDYKLKGGKDWWKVNPEKTEVISTYDFKENKGLDVLLKGMFNKKSKYEL